MAPSELNQSMAEIRAAWSADELRTRRQAALRAQSMLRALVCDIVFDADLKSSVFADDENAQTRETLGIAG
ncbi:hypothetical protein [Rubripirellula reticaptiva]|uniref:Uncharacterized protein n=1 Tax=Rubripirellula reticaptiva TaxID=2528013 RepID=A0A5C6EGT6_9BACT|nr:hypothetical protein [Rubripirellula reticaptiva]TWU46806.1 hypothetical protein Poly59_57790 [Rubripirellula reticaptiva]